MVFMTLIWGVWDQVKCVGVGFMGGWSRRPLFPTTRLHLRGYPFWFLATAFATGPRFEQRLEFLFPTKDARPDTPVIVFSTEYNCHLMNAGLSRAIFLYRDWLPRHFDTVKLINAWRVGQKLGRQLIAFNTDSADTGFTAGSENLPDVSHTDTAGTAGTTGTSTLDVIAEAGSDSQDSTAETLPTPRQNSPSHSDES
eukprot:SAG11_NODE_25_length_23789_cov_23.813592_7_plen_197_part_00